MPGMLLTRFAGIERARMCMSIAFSVTVLVAVLALSKLTGLGTFGFGLLLLGSYMSIAAGTLVTRLPAGFGQARILRIESLHAVPVVVVAGVVVYVAWAGPYLEVPADAWWHLDRISRVLQELGDGMIEPMQGAVHLLDKENYYWHTLTAYFIYLAGMGLEESLPYLALANTVLLCIGVYSFSLFTFEQLETSRREQYLMSAAALLFFVTQFGVNVFSYVRYYVFAPTYLNYIVYLAALVCLMEFLSRTDRSFRVFLAGTILLLVAGMVHFQEAVFIIVLGGTLLLVESTRCLIAGSGASDGEADQTKPENARTLWLFALLVCGYTVSHVLAYWTLEKENPLAHGLMSDIRYYIPFLQNLYVLKPTGQFYQVVTVWGVLVYSLFLLHGRRFLRSSYLVAGMTVPFVTVFNPVFTDFFLRFAGPEVIWRMCYMVPLFIVGGYFLVKALDSVVGARSMLAKASGLTIAVALVALLLPVRTAYFVAPYSKVYTLAPVSEGNSHRVWNDLLAFLDTRENSGIITDQVTGYVLNGLTNHKYRGYKFYSRYASHIDLQEYDRDFRKKNGWKRLVSESGFKVKEPWMVVVNRRDGDLSETGRYGGHWPEDVMHVSKQYSESFLRYIEDEESMFRKVWDRNGIKVYEVIGT